jgi:transposase
MAKPYSMDLRERVVAATGRGLSCRQAAKRFGVAASTAIGWVKRVRTTGSAAPGKMGGWRRGKITGEHRDWLAERCKSGDFTLRGLVVELAGRGLKVDYRTMWAFVRAENLSYKNVWPAPLQAASSILTAPVCVNVYGLSGIAVAKMEIRAFQALKKTSA